MDRVRGEKLVLQQDPGFGPVPQGDPVPPIRGTKLPTSSCPCALCFKEETQQGMSTLQEPSETLDSNPCCTHSLPRADLQWSTDPAQVKRQLWGLQATSKEAHLAKDETFWKRKSRARKSLFQKNPMGRKVKSLDLSIIQEQWKQGQERTELHRSLTQQLQDTLDLEVSGSKVRERLAEKGSGFLPLGKGNPGSFSSPDISILELHSETFGNGLIYKEGEKEMSLVS